MTHSHSSTPNGEPTGRKRTIALFPGSFDPITLGHIDVVTESLNIFDHVVLGIGISRQKTCAFSQNERQELAQSCLAQFGERVTVSTFEGLAVKYAKSIGAEFIVRGLRTENDFSYEMPMAMTNRKLERSVLTVFIPTSAKNHYVSSSLVREIAILGGDITAFVPAAIVQPILAKLS